MNKKRIFLTGSRGFIGRNIKEQLIEKFEFFTPDHEELELADSAAVTKYLQKIKPDYVIHSANIGGNRKQAGLHDVAFVNLQIFYSIIAAKQYYKKLIVFGSGAEYDKRFAISQVVEADFNRTVPVDQYGFAKYVMSKYAEQVNYITHLRIFGMFGKYEDFQVRFISNSICKALFGLPITIKQNVIFDYVYVNDFVKIIDKQLTDNTLSKSKFYNIGTGHSISLIDIAKIIVNIIDADLPIIIMNDGLGNEYSCNADLLNNELGDFKFTPLDNAIRELTKHYQNELPLIDKNIFLKDV